MIRKIIEGLVIVLFPLMLTGIISMMLESNTSKAEIVSNRREIKTLRETINENLNYMRDDLRIIKEKLINEKNK